MEDEKPIWCFLGWHRWSPPYDYSPRNYSRTWIGALLEDRHHKVKCELCGKVKKVNEK